MSILSEKFVIGFNSPFLDRNEILILIFPDLHSNFTNMASNSVSGINQAQA